MSASARLEAPRLWIVLSRCHRAVSQIAEHSIAETGLGLSDFAALEALLHKGPLTITRDSGQSAAGQRLDDCGGRPAGEERPGNPKGYRERPAREEYWSSRRKESASWRAAFRRHAVELEAAMAILNSAEKRQLYGPS